MRSLTSTDTYSFRTLLAYWLSAIAVLLMVFFVLFQARFLITGPQIVLTSAPEGPQNTRHVELSGVAYNISRLWLNDRAIYTDKQGHFREEIVLENGYTIATLRAEDRYGRTTEVQQRLVYVPASFVY
jgi:hypothetical protein